MEENDDGEVNSSSSNDSNVIYITYDGLAREWINSSMVAVASTASAAAVWLQLTTADVALHTSTLQPNPAARASVHRAVIDSIMHSERKCRGLLRLSPIAFECLVSELKSKTRVKKYTRSTIEEQLVVFLLILSHNWTNQVASCFLSRSGEMISRYFHNILVATITLEAIYVKDANPTEVQPSILESHRFFSYFKDCLGAIDGTHVRVKVAQVDVPRYRGSKDWPTQNVLAACTFDLKFTYILAGWEGSAAVARELQSALTRDDNLVIPNGKFYLGDAGFGLTTKVLTPYARTRYHLKEYSHRGPETAKELFNHRHSSLRNAIERAFGVLKKRFPIIASGTECQYSASTMTNIILACCVLHNFMISCDVEDLSEVTVQGVTADDAESSLAQADVRCGMNQDASLEHSRGQELRDPIANEMWADYCLHG